GRKTCRFKESPFSPHANDENNQAYANHDYQIRHDPRKPVEAAIGWDGEHGCPVIQNEPLQHAVVGFSAINCRHQFVAHSRRVTAANVIALEQNLIAAADTHHLMAKAVDAHGVIACAEQQQHSCENGSEQSETCCGK